MPEEKLSQEEQRLHPPLVEKRSRLVQSWVENKPDISLEELCAQLEERTQMKVSKPTMCRAVQRLEMPRKKKHCMRVSKILLLFVNSETITVAVARSTSGCAKLSIY